MDPKQKIEQIEQLNRELDVLLDQATANAPERVQESVKALQADKQKLIYQANILRRSVNAEKLEAEKNNVLSPFERVKPSPYQAPSGKVLPKAGEQNIMITSALPYVNNVPHLGNIVGCVLSADVFARYSRFTGKNTLYVCGTDEYGTATETKAFQDFKDLYDKDVRQACKAVCDKYHALHKEVYQWFQISTDHFGRTSTQHQDDVVHEIFDDLDKRGMWLEKDVDQLFSPKLDKFLADRFVEGTCPKPECAYEDARGDQCDKCGGLLNAIDLLNPRCKFTGCTPEIRTSRHLFLNLPKIESDLKVWLNEVTSEWSNNAKQIFDSWIKKGLEPRCMTRDLKWGVKVPKEGYDHKVFYVWFDAPIGYPSITAEYTPKWRDWWLTKDGKEVKYYQFMGKDNVPFHSVLFPSYLLGTGKPWNLVNVINATEYLNYENGKFSKSRGVGVFGNQASETNIPADVWRFYLIYMRPEVQDTEFQWTDFQLKNNSELLNNLGNFINRGLSFVVKFYDGKVPSAEINGNMRAWVAEVNELLKQYIDCMENNHQREGLRRVLAISKLGNKLIQTWQPWVKVKSKDPALRNEASACVMLSANLVFLLSSLLEPFMPMTSFEIARQVGVARAQIPTKFGAFLEKDHKIYESRPLFRKIEDDEIKEYRARFAGKSDK